MKTLFSLLLLPICGFARLGDTEAQCIERYGEPTDRHPGTAPVESIVEFHQQGTRIVAEFSQGHVVSMLFGRPDGPAFTSAELVDILKDSAGESRWSSPVREGGGEIFKATARREDQKAEATVSIIKGKITTIILEDTTFSSTRNQCQAVTKDGSRCTRQAKPGSQFCWQHAP